MWSYRRLLPLLAICAGLILAPGPAYADDNDAAKAARAVDRAEAVLENATAKARVAALRLQAATSALPAALNRVARSRGAVAAALVAANTAERRATTERAAYARIETRSRQAQDRVAAARTQVDLIARAAYMGSNISRINVVVEASGPADMMDRLSLVSQVMRTQQTEVDTLIGARRDAQIEQDNAGLAKQQAEAAEWVARAKLRAAKSAQAAAENAQAALLTLTRTRQAAMRMATQQRSAVLARYETARAEERRVQAALRGWSVRAGGQRYAGGQLLMPVDGWKSSDFGERYDPYYRVWQLHAGTDIAAAGGSPIHVAASGRVIRAGWNGGYGNYTCVDHGKIQGRSFQTCYGHQSRILVSVGQRVHRGEVIGRVGTTGASTGYHLHFETRFDGVPRNPLQYLPPCLC